MKVQIQTTQNVDIEYDVAGLGERIAAASIDILIMIGYIVAVVWILIQTEVFDDLPEDVVIVVMLLLYLPLFLYHLICEIFMDGQSFGKKAIHIRVVKLDGGQPSIGGYILRWLIGIIEASPFFFLGVPAIMTILINGKGQRLGDLAANTTVVKTKTPVTLDQTIFARLEEDYTPVFPQVTKLNDRDVGIIKEVIDSRDQMNNPVVVGTLARKIMDVTGIESDMPSLKLLRTVVKDYNYYTGKL
jgi:uncharacterized RDD family membrane protein YckC